MHEIDKSRLAGVLRPTCSRCDGQRAESRRRPARIRRSHALANRRNQPRRKSPDQPEVNEIKTASLDTLISRIHSTMMRTNK
jgi:hypothetical protein